MNETPPPPDDDSFLGPLEVVRADRTGVWVCPTPAGSPHAVELAFTFPYSPRVGDQLLVIGRAADLYAIGVLGGTGAPALAFRGDVDLHAVGGSLNLEAGQAIRLEAPEITLSGDCVRTFAESVSERAESAYRWVRGQLTVRAGESQRTVLGEDHTRARRSVTLAEETVKIDGHQLQLGH